MVRDVPYNISLRRYRGWFSVTFADGFFHKGFVVIEVLRVDL